MVLACIFSFFPFSLSAGRVSCIAISFGGAISVNITGIFSNTALPFLSSNLIQDSRESLDDVPERRK